MPVIKAKIKQTEAMTAISFMIKDALKDPASINVFLISIIGPQIRNPII